MLKKTIISCVVLCWCCVRSGIDDPVVQDKGKTINGVDEGLIEIGLPDEAVSIGDESDYRPYPGSNG